MAEKKPWKHKMQGLADARAKELAVKRDNRGLLGKLKAGTPGTKEWDEDREAESVMINSEYHFDADTLDKLKKDTGYKKGVKEKRKSDDKKLSKVLKELS